MQDGIFQTNPQIRAPKVTQKPTKLNTRQHQNKKQLWTPRTLSCIHFP